MQGIYSRGGKGNQEGGRRGKGMSSSAPCLERIKAMFLQTFRYIRYQKKVINYKYLHSLLDCSEYIFTKDRTNSLSYYIFQKQTNKTNQRRNTLSHSRTLYFLKLFFSICYFHIVLPRDMWIFVCKADCFDFSFSLVICNTGKENMFLLQHC